MWQCSSHMQEALTAGCTAVCCSYDATYVGDAQGCVWVIGCEAPHNVSHGLAVALPGSAVHCIAADPNRLIVGTAAGQLYAYAQQSGSWGAVCKVCARLTPDAPPCTLTMWLNSCDWF